MTRNEQSWNEKNKGFGLKVVCEGIYTDNTTDDTRIFKVEVITIRLTSTALNEWILSSCFNCRECYETEEEWQAHMAIKNDARTTWEDKIKAILSLTNVSGGVSITQAQSEVFTVVHIF